MQAITLALLGLVLAFGVAPGLAAGHRLLAGWTGWVGLILFLHFGTFHLLALILRRGGIAVRPIMENPLAATSVSDFWGRRRNHAFQEIAQRLWFRPVARAAGVRWATLAVFAISGLLHELVITVPARGGYGGPTLYFLIQGGALLLEKSRVARVIGLDGGWRARTFTLLVVAAPVVVLFPPPFLRDVILPFVSAVASPLR